MPKVIQINIPVYNACWADVFAGKYGNWKCSHSNIIHTSVQRYTNTQLCCGGYINEHFPNYIQRERFSHFEQSFFIKFTIHFKHFHIYHHENWILFCINFVNIECVVRSPKLLIFMYSATKTSFSSSVMILLLN